MKDLNDFLKEYDDGTLMFPNVMFRSGARITCKFALAEGYTLQPNGNLVFDTIRTHSGVDRSAMYNKNSSVIKNVVYCPFDFNRSASIYYGPKTSYGYLVQLFNDDYGFEMRIAHMNPNSDLKPEIKKILESNGPIARNTLLGKAGNFGVSGGAHTHAEFISQGLTCKVFDDLLEKKHGHSHEYTDTEIYTIYSKQSKWEGKQFSEMKAHYEQLKKDRGISFMSKYKYTYIDPSTGKKRTRYSSELLFNGL